MKEYFKNQLKKAKKELIKWAIIWAVGTFGSLIGLAIFILSTQERTPPPNLPWWPCIPTIVCAILALPLIKKAWEFDKLEESQRLSQEN